MKVVQGDLLKLALRGEFDVIVHGCNCQCAMGAGIARSIKTAFPEAYEADYATKADLNKLGSISFAEVERNDRQITVVNTYTQFHWHGKKPLVNYDAVRQAMKKIAKQFSGKRIGYPLIGAGLAGGDWSIIARIVDEELIEEDHTLVEFSG